MCSSKRAGTASVVGSRYSSNSFFPVLSPHPHPPQVAHTYALFEAGYGIMNEHQVAIGESTCASKLWAAPTTAGGSAMVDARELTRIALERSMTAKEAVLLMGDIAEKYGFYAADWSGGDDSKGEGGEALTVVDPNEAWVFHVLSDDTGTSAVWAAQRVQDDHVSLPGTFPIFEQTCYIAQLCCSCLYSSLALGGNDEKCTIQPFPPVCSSPFIRVHDCVQGWPAGSQGNTALKQVEAIKRVEWVTQVVPSLSLSLPSVCPPGIVWRTV